MSEGEVMLVVRAVEKCDADHGIARLPEAARRVLGVLSGETIIIEGSRGTVTRMWPTHPGAVAGEMLVDADMRASAGVKTGDNVRAKKIAVEGARSVTLVGPSAFGRTSVGHGTIEEVAKAELRNRPVHEGDRIRVERLGRAALAVSEAVPEGVVRVADATTISVAAASSKDAGKAVHDTIKNMTGSDNGGDDGSRGRVTGVTCEDTDGLDNELSLVHEMIELPLSEPKVFTRPGIEPPKGVLLHGPPGTRKILIAKAVANRVDASSTTISGPEVLSKYKDESKEKLQEVLQSTRGNALAIIFFDEIDSIASKHDDGGDLGNRVVGQLLSLMDGLDAHDDMIVVGTTNRVDNLDPALRRGGRFDREIEIGTPNEAGRREILDVHTRRVPLVEDVDIDRLTSRTHSFVGADPGSLAREAAMTALRRVRREDGGGSGDDGGKVAVADMTVTHADFESAMATVEPSTMREYVAEQPTEGFEGVGGLDDVKRALERVVTWPLTYAPLHEAASTDPPTGLLLHGSPRTGKTIPARTIATESDVDLIHVASPKLLDRYIGESKKSVRKVFNHARQAAPSIVFFDEIDTIATDHDSAGSDLGISERVVSQLLTEMDNATDNPNLVVLAATNRRDALDPALLRPGQLETYVEVPAPNIEIRRAILDVHVRDKPLGTDVGLGDVAAHIGGYTGADVATICRKAALRTIQDVAGAYDGTEADEHVDEVRTTRAHFDAALESVSPTRV